MTDELRAKFEAWAQSHAMSIIRDGVVTDYAFFVTDAAWNAWQAAYASRDAEVDMYRSVHRWSVERNDKRLQVCKNNHDKDEPCEWETFVPIAEVEAMKSDVRQRLPAGWKIEIRFIGAAAGLCVIGPPGIGAFSIDGDAAPPSDIRDSVIRALSAAMREGK